MTIEAKYEALVRLVERLLDEQYAPGWRDPEYDTDFHYGWEVRLLNLMREAVKEYPTP